VSRSADNRDPVDRGWNDQIYAMHRNGRNRVERLTGDRGAFAEKPRSVVVGLEIPLPEEPMRRAQLRGVAYNDRDDGEEFFFLVQHNSPWAVRLMPRLYMPAVRLSEGIRGH